MNRKTFTTICGTAAAGLGALAAGLVTLATAQQAEVIVLAAGATAAVAGGFAAMYAFLLKTDTPEVGGA